MSMLATTGLAGRPINLLLVEDDELDVMNVRRAFERGGLPDQLWVAGDGLAGLEILRGGELPRERRLVLLDINMPRMSGLEMLREMRADPSLQMTTVVVLSTSNHDRDLVEAYKLNVAGYLVKPVTFVAFVQLMTALHQYWTMVELP
jgi:CheY-like chemotaxis protein